MENCGASRGFGYFIYIYIYIYMSEGLIKIKVKKKKIAFGKLDELLFPLKKRKKKNCYFSLTNLNVVVLVH